MHLPGSISKVAVRDFVTYSSVELKPGRNLNIVMGPNGTGKSTIVAAIILGLGGDPKTVGRGTKVSEYVRHGCTDATIKIYLHGSRESETIKIMRHFNIQDKSTWKLNDKPSTKQEIENVIKRFNIQVNNLCQFLPQDRVQDFAKLNKQQLLLQTQTAICRHDLLDKQQELIQIRESHRNIHGDIEKDEQQLRELQDANLRVEGKIQNSRAKKKYLTQIGNVERKVAWIFYEQFRSKLDEYKADKITATEAYATEKTKAKPIEDSINDVKKLITSVQSKITENGRSMRENESTVERSIERCDELKRQIRQVEDEVSVKVADIEQNAAELKECCNELEKLQQQKAAAAQQHSDQRKSEEVVAKFQQQMQDVGKIITDLKEQKAVLEDSKRQKVYEARQYQCDMERLENVKNQRLEWLRRKDNDAYQAVMWLRENRHKFEGAVYEPIALELNILNPKHAVYLENLIPLRDKVAFTCVLKSDMNKLMAELREQLKLSINVVHSGNDLDIRSFRNPIPIEQLRPFGFYAYANTLYTGPDPILKYLCKTYNMHCTPIGDQTVNAKYEQVPSKITQFFSDVYRFNNSISKYSKEKLTRQYAITADGSLSVSVNPDRIEEIRSRLSENQKHIDDYDTRLRKFDSKIEEITEKRQQIGEKVREIQGSRQQVRVLDSRIRILEQKINQMQLRQTDKDTIERTAHNTIEKLVKQLCDAKGSMVKLTTKRTELLQQSELDKIKLDQARKEVTYFQNEIHDTRQRLAELQETLERINRVYTNAKNEGKVALKKAKDLSKGFTPDDNGFEEFRAAYDRLPDDVEVLEAERQHVLCKMDCLNTADEVEIREYESRVQAITCLQEKMENTRSRLDGTENDIERLREEWFTPLEEIVGQINARFSNAFERMGCAGEVSIYKGTKDTEFAEYGLSIKVKYRDTEPLQELNNVVQSGGERAVATAAYMLSLQELTPVPFRCVDEINQGMDPNNERRVFELLVDVTTQDDSPQYFFITPKLVPKLKFGSKMTFHTVLNGPLVNSPPENDWVKAVNAYINT